MEFAKLTILAAPRSEHIEDSETVFWKQFKNSTLIKEHASIQAISFQVQKPHSFALCSSTRVQLYDSTLLTPKKTISRFSDVVHACSIRRDGKLLLAGDASGLVQLFDLGSRAILRTLKGHGDAVKAVGFIGSGDTVFSGSDDSTARVWDVTSQTATSTFEGHGDYVRSCASAACNPTTLATGSYDQTIKLWDSRANECIMTLQHGSPVEQVLMFPTGTLLASAGGSQMKIWDIIAGGRLLSTVSNHQKTITSMVFNSDATRILTGSLDSHVRVYSTDAFKVVHSIRFPAPILSLGISSNDTILAVGMSNGTLAVRKRVIRSQDIQQLKENLKNGSRDYYARGGHSKPIETDIVFQHRKSQKLTRYETLLKSFSYREALNDSRNPAIVVALINDLINRDGLRIALGGKDDVGLDTLARFILKHFASPLYSQTLIHVTSIVLDMYGDVICGSIVCEGVFKKLKEMLDKEIKVQRLIMETLGMVEAIQSCVLAIDE